MSKTITRKYIQRITKREGNTSIRQSGGGGGGGGGASQYWVEDNYVSKLFFNRLFTVLDEDGNPIEPNDTETVIESIQSMFGFWTNAYLSALGQNPEGGEVALTLASLADVDVSTVSNGDALVWNAAIRKWVPGQGGMDLTAMWAALGSSSAHQIDASHLSTALAGYATQTWVGQQGYITASALNGYATESWVGSQISDMATQTWVENNYLSQTDAATTYLSKTDAANTYLSIAFFARLFRAYNGSTAVNPNDTTSTIDNIKAMFGFWTEQYISALGNSGGGSAYVTMDQVWTALGNATNEQINASHLSTALSAYNPTSNFKTINGNSIIGTGDIVIQGGGGTVTAVKVGSTSYTPTDGVVSLPAYPTKASWNYDDTYLKLTGGTMANTNKVTNLNADLLDGWSYDNFVPSGYVTSSTENLSSYWGCMWDITLIDRIYSEYDITFLIQSSFNQLAGIVHCKLRQNGTGTSRNIDAKLNLMAGNIPFDRVRMYYNNSTGYCALWVDVVGQWGNFNASILKKTERTGYDEPSMGSFKGTKFSTVQDFPSGASYVELKAYTLNTSVSGNAGTATKLQTARTIWGGSFDGTGNVDGKLTISSDPYNTGTENSLLNILINGKHDYGVAMKIHSYGGDAPCLRFSHSDNADDLNSQINDNWSIGMQQTSYNNFAITQNRGTTGWGNIRLLIDNSGNVGIGTTTPAYKLSVNGDVSATNFRGNLVGNADSATKLQTARTLWGQSFDGTANVSGDMSGVSKISFTAGGHFYLDKYANLHATNNSDNTNWNVCRYDGRSAISIMASSGNIGIDTKNPAYKLDVNGTLGVNGLITASGGITIPSGKTLTIGDAVLSWDSTNQGIKITKGLYSETFISALGAGSSGSGGVDMNTVWTALGNATSEQINVSHLSTALSGYATQSWVQQQLTGGTVTAVKVGTTTYNPSSGVVSLPAYLPLTGGNLSGSITFANNTWNTVGDDSKIGDINVVGAFGVKGANGQTAIAFVNKDNSYYVKLTSPVVTSNITVNLPSSAGTLALTTDLSSYLPLAGGTMSNTNLVTNLNADLLDGYQAKQLPLITTFSGTSIASNTDLNDILDAGTYYCIAGSVATTLSNMPSYAGGNFRLWHIVNTGDDGSGSSQWSSQIFLAPNSGQMFIRSHNENGFGTWKEFAFSSDYLPLSGGTMMGSIKQKLAGVTRGTAPTVNNYRTYEFVDASGVRLSQVEAGVLNSGENRLHLYVLNHSTSTDKYGGLVIYKQVGLDTNYTAMLNANTGELTTSKFIGALEGNATTATKLQTARTIWGQSFNGTGNVSGAMSGVTSIDSLLYFDTTNNRIGVNTSSPADGVHLEKKNVLLQNTSSNDGIWVELKGVSYDWGIATGSGNVNRGIIDFGGAGWMLYFDASNTYCEYGNFICSGGVTALSDARHKSIVGGTEISVEQIARMRSVKFLWNDGRADNGVHVGSIAQDWQNVLPEVVIRKDDAEGTLSLNYGVAALISVITTARKVVDHERKIRELEKEVEQLKTV